MSFVQELKRRNVIRVGMAYLAGAWLIVQVVDTVIPWLGWDESVGRTLLIVLVVGFVPAVIAAWLFEWTPDGIKFDDEVEVDAAGSVVARRRMDRVIIAVLALAVVYFAVDEFLFDAEQTGSYYGDRSIAVLPFSAASSDAEQQFVASGIAFEVNDLLAQFHDLRVISNRSVLTVVEQGLTVMEMGDRLNVGHLLEGTVQRYGDSVRVTAQLIDARTDRQLWSETYERQADDIFRLQDELAAAVAEELQINLLGPLPKSLETDPRARDLTLQAKQLSERRPPDVGQKMKVLLDEALALDPEYVPALEGMMLANFFREQAGVLPAEDKERLDDALKQRIRLLDPDNAWTLNVDAWNAAYRRVDFERAAALYQRAIASDPSDANGMRLAGIFARDLGRLDVSLRMLRHAVALDPLCYQCIYHLGRTYMNLGRYDAALREHEKFLALESTSVTGRQLEYAVMLQLVGKNEEALAYLEPLELDATKDARVVAALAMAEYGAGRITEAEDKLASLIAEADSYFYYELVASVAAWMGKSDLAFEYLDLTFGKPGDADPRTIGASLGTLTAPEYLHLHDDPRWIALRASIGMSAERLDAIEFNPQLPHELMDERVN